MRKTIEITLISASRNFDTSVSLNFEDNPRGSKNPRGPVIPGKFSILDIFMELMGTLLFNGAKLTTEATAAKATATRKDIIVIIIIEFIN